MSMKTYKEDQKAFLTWVLMKYGRNPIPFFKVRLAYSDMIGYKREGGWENTTLGWDDYEENGMRGLWYYFSDSDEMRSVNNDGETLNERALEYINEP